MDTRGTFSAPLSVLSGTIAVENQSSGQPILDGSITVAGGATLDTVQSNNGWIVIANGDVNINASGTLSGLNAFSFRWSTFTNNGSVSVVNCKFERTGAQTLAGNGAFVSNTATIVSGSTTTLTSNHQLSRLTIDSGGTLISHRACSECPRAARR